jgi:NHL repeat
MGLLLVSGVNQSVSRRLVQLRGVLSPWSLAMWVDTYPFGAIVAIALGIAAMLAFSAGVARAEAPTLVPDGQFESEGALGVAVDQSTSESDASRGDVYVAGFVTELTNPARFVPGRVNKFDVAGSVLQPPSPFGEAGFGYSGAAVNPVNGNVYALDAQTSEIDTYNPATGAPESPPFSVEASGNFSFIIPWTVVGIAADSAGNVYVPVVPKNEVLEYDPATCPAVPEPCVPLKTFTGGSGAGALKGPTSVAVDPAGNVWVADAGNERVEELSPADTPIHEIRSEGVQSVAVDAHGDVFATVLNSADFCGKIQPPCPHLVEYSSSGAQLADLGAGTIGAQGEGTGLGLPDMVAVSDSSGRVYVTEGIDAPPPGVHGRILKFTPPVVPKLEGEVAVEVGVSEAKLGAVVNPGGLSAAYRFEYGTTPAYGNTVPFPEGDTGGGFHSRTVWASASGLSPATTYHYRVIVTGALGEPLVGNDQTFTTGTAAQASCPNEQSRTGFSASLPDCRAYELVTPPNKSGAEPDPPLEGGLKDPEAGIEQGLEGNLAAADGNRVSFKAEEVFPGSKSAAEFYVVTRGPSGWLTENVTTPKNYYGFECSVPSPSYSADLSKEIVVVGGDAECGGPEPELVSGEPRGVDNVFMRDNTTGSYQLLDAPPAGVVPTRATFVAGSADLSHVVFSERAKLTADALGGAENLYEWSGGVLRLLTVLPDGTPVAGSFAGISPDGSRIFFTDAGKLYARVNGVSTVQVDASQAGGSGGGGSVVSASADGSRVLISDDAAAGLTDDTVPGSGRNLYLHDFASGRLSDLTSAARAEVLGVMGASEDLSRVYFQAEGSLAAGATQGQPNPYVWHAGATTFIAPLANAAPKKLWVSANGAFLGFSSTQRLTAYDNTDANTGQPDPEIYLYNAATNGLACASCNPSDAPPTSGPRVETAHSARNVSDSGRVFFETSEALLAADTNGQQDVYEFEPSGVGSCGDPGGCLSLISTGTGAIKTWLIEASPSGNDVFLLEHQNLVPLDTEEESRKIYDVRVDGGIPEPVTPPVCTTADACRTAPIPQPSIFGAPASQTFSGAGNLLAPAPAVNPPAKLKPKPKKCRKGYVKKKNKCVKAKKGKKGKKASRARAKANLKGSK